jgi:hypothetical protein
VQLKPQPPYPPKKPLFYKSQAHKGESILDLSSPIDVKPVPRILTGGYWLSGVTYDLRSAFSQCLGRRLMTAWTVRLRCNGCSGIEGDSKLAPSSVGLFPVSAWYDPTFSHAA